MIKKILFTLVTVLFFVPAFAQLEQGRHILGLRTGLGFQLQNSGITYSTNEGRINWGTLGAEAGLSYYYLLTSHVGVGADVSYGDYDGTNLTWSANNSAEDSTRLANLMLAARLTAGPSHPVRFYIPFGAGLVIARQNLSVHYHSTHYEKKKTDTSLGYFIGAGMEFDFGRSGWGLGLESRYNVFWYDTDKIVRGAPSPIHGDGNRKYEYFSFNFNFTKRF